MTPILSEPKQKELYSGDGGGVVGFSLKGSILGQVAPFVKTKL